MTEFLQQLFIQPLLIIYRSIFDWFLEDFTPPGIAILGLSLAMNLALLPVYFQMERAGESVREARARMDAELARMKRHFKGRELFFYTRAVHRQFGHRPIDVIFQSSDLFLQILVFTTMFHFLAHAPELEGHAFLDIKDLSRPDGLLFGLNLLPLLMTLANVGSAILYGDDPARRRQAYILAGVFLVLLYASPAGMVLYWTANNVFSLVRNLVVRVGKRAAGPGWHTAWTRWVGLQ